MRSAFQQKTFSFPTQNSHPSAFTITGVISRIQCVKEKQAGSHKVFLHVLLFGDNLQAAKDPSQFCHCTSATIKPKKRGIGKKLLLTKRAVMLVDLVAGDFNGAAWRRTTSASPLSITGEAFADCDLPLCLLAPHHCGVPGLCQVHGQTCAGLLSTQTPTSVGKYGNTVHSPFSTKVWASGRPIRAAITKYGTTWILWRGAAVSHTTKDTSHHSS